MGAPGRSKWQDCLQAAALDTWNDVALVADAAERMLALDEHLVAHVARDGVAGGDLDARPIFEIRTGRNRNRNTNINNHRTYNNIYDFATDAANHNAVNVLAVSPADTALESMR